MREPIILASASPRRRELLARLGVGFVARPVDVDETVGPNEEPGAAAMRLARAKALAAAPGADGAVVLAADTIVVLDGQVLGKPSSEAEACAYLDRLRGRAHRVATAVVVLDSGAGKRAEGIEWTTVWLRGFSDEERDRYVATGDPLDKAGGYAIQHACFRPVARIDGSESNVIGLPLGLTRRLLDEIGGRAR